MDKIARLLQQLESPKKDQRYEACEWLRAAPSLPPEAIAALEAHTNDPDKEVAERARAAIAVHTASDGPAIPQLPGAAKSDLRNQNLGAIVAVLVFTPLMLFASLASGDAEWISVQMCWCSLAPVAAALGWAAVAAARAWGWRITSLTMVVAFVGFGLATISVEVLRGRFTPIMPWFLFVFAPVAASIGLACFALAKACRGRWPILWAGVGGIATDAPWMFFLLLRGYR